MYVHIYIHIRVCVYIYIYTHTRTHTHIRSNAAHYEQLQAVQSNNEKLIPIQ